MVISLYLYLFIFSNSGEPQQQLLSALLKLCRESSSPWPYEPLVHPDTFRVPVTENFRFGQTLKVAPAF